jgi:hypothetical protein
MTISSGLSVVRVVAVLAVKTRQTAGGLHQKRDFFGANLLGIARIVRADCAGCTWSVTQLDV